MRGACVWVACGGGEEMGYGDPIEIFDYWLWLLFASVVVRRPNVIYYTIHGHVIRHTVNTTFDALSLPQSTNHFYCVALASAETVIAGIFTKLRIALWQWLLRLFWYVASMLHYAHATNLLVSCCGKIALSISCRCRRLFLHLSFD